MTANGILMLMIYGMGLLAGLLEPGDVVLVKASRSYALEVLAADLLTDATSGTTGKGTA